MLAYSNIINKLKYFIHDVKTILYHLLTITNTIIINYY